MSASSDYGDMASSSTSIGLEDNRGSYPADSSVASNSKSTGSNNVLKFFKREADALFATKAFLALLILAAAGSVAGSAYAVTRNEQLSNFQTQVCVLGL